MFLCHRTTFAGSITIKSHLCWELKFGMSGGNNVWQAPYAPTVSDQGCCTADWFIDGSGSYTQFVPIIVERLKIYKLNRITVRHSWNEIRDSWNDLSYDFSGQCNLCRYSDSAGLKAIKSLTAPSFRIQINASDIQLLTWMMVKSHLCKANVTGCSFATCSVTYFEYLHFVPSRELLSWH